MGYKRLAFISGLQKLHMNTINIDYKHLVIITIKIIKFKYTIIKTNITNCMTFKDLDL